MARTCSSVTGAAEKVFAVRASRNSRSWASLASSSGSEIGDTVSPGSSVTGIRPAVGSRVRKGQLVFLGKDSVLPGGPSHTKPEVAAWWPAVYTGRSRSRTAAPLPTGGPGTGPDRVRDAARRRRSKHLDPVAGDLGGEPALRKVGVGAAQHPPGVQQPPA